MKKYNEYIKESLITVLKTEEYWKPIYKKINQINSHRDSIITWGIKNIMDVNYNREIIIAYSIGNNDPNIIKQNVKNVVDELNNDNEVKKFYDVTYEQIFDKGKTYLKYAIYFKIHPHIYASLDHGLI